MTDFWETYDEIKLMLEAGKTKPAIAKALNIGVSTIYKIQKELREAV